jgi:hypothetical protein
VGAGVWSDREEEAGPPMSETPEERKARWDSYIATHHKSAQDLRATDAEIEPAALRGGLATLHEGIALLSSFMRDREVSTAEPAHAEYHKVRQAHLYALAANRFASAGDFAQLALRSAIIANGGALVAILTFLGHTGRTVSGISLWLAVIAFVLGLFAALVTVFFAFQAQAAFGRQEAAGSDKIYFHLLSDREKCDEEDALETKQMAIGGKWQLAGEITYIISIVLFVLGAVAGILALTAR